jgi:hypothetical protein
MVPALCGIPAQGGPKLAKLYQNCKIIRQGRYAYLIQKKKQQIW